MEKPKFIKEIEKFEWKERTKCWKWFIRVYWKLDNKPMVELESLQILIKELHKLEEENRKLKLHIEAKDKAYTALLKDYEEIKEDRDRIKEEIEQRLNAFRNR